MRKLLVASAIVAVVLMATPALADDYPPTEPPCVDCNTADTGLHAFTSAGVDPLKVGVLLFVVGLGAVLIARRRA